MTLNEIRCSGTLQSQWSTITDSTSRKAEENVNVTDESRSSGSSDDGGRWRQTRRSEWKRFHDLAAAAGNERSRRVDLESWWLCGRNGQQQGVGWTQVTTAFDSGWCCMSATSWEMSCLDACCWTMQNCLQMIVGQLIVSAASEWMLCHIFHNLNFLVGLCGPLGDSSWYGLGQRAGVRAPLI